MRTLIEITDPNIGDDHVIISEYVEIATPVTVTASGSLDIDGLTAESSFVAADTVPFYDASAAGNRKVTGTNLAAGVANLLATGAVAVTKLAAGTEGYVLTVVSGVPAWAAAGAGSFDIAALTPDASLAAGDVVAMNDGGNKKITGTNIAASIALLLANDAVALSAVNIAGATADTSLGSSDVVPLHDGAAKKITGSNLAASVAGLLATDAVALSAVNVSGATADTALGASDVVPLHDGAAKKITGSNLATSIADLFATHGVALTKVNLVGATTETSLASGDLLPLYDLSGTANRVMTASNVAAGIATLFVTGAIAPAKITAGTEGYVLTVVSGVPAWAAAAGGLDIVGLTSEPLIVTADQLPFYDASATANRKCTFGEFAAAIATEFATDSLALAKVNIAGATADTSLAASDVVAMNDGANKKINGTDLATSIAGLLADAAIALPKLNINGATAETSLASGDKFPLYDLSNTANRAMTASNVAAGVAGLFADGAVAATKVDIDGASAASSLATGEVLLVRTSAGNRKLTVDNLLASLRALGAPSAVYGDGSDGDVTLSGNVTLTRSMSYGTLDLATHTLTTAGYEVCANELVTGNGGKITRAGNNGSGTSAGAGLTGAVLGPSIAGGAGGATTGSNGTATTANQGTAAGGAGGAGSGGAGGAAGGAANPFNQAIGSTYSLHFLRFGMWAKASSGVDGTLPAVGGAGGGGGGGDGSLAGGGGGGGGGVLQVAAPLITGTLTLEAKGGDGAAGPGTNRGGGGGGGGGAVLVLTYTGLVGGSVTRDVSGGAGGAGGGGSGVSGSAGSTGQLRSGAMPW